MYLVNQTTPLGAAAGVIAIDSDSIVYLKTFTGNSVGQVLLKNGMVFNVVHASFKTLIESKGVTFKDITFRNVLSEPLGTLYVRNAVSITDLIIGYRRALDTNLCRLNFIVPYSPTLFVDKDEVNQFFIDALILEEPLE